MSAQGLAVVDCVRGAVVLTWQHCLCWFNFEMDIRVALYLLVASGFIFKTIGCYGDRVGGGRCRAGVGCYMPLLSNPSPSGVCTTVRPAWCNTKFCQLLYKLRHIIFSFYGWYFWLPIEIDSLLTMAPRCNKIGQGGVGEWRKMNISSAEPVGPAWCHDDASALCPLNWFILSKWPLLSSLSPLSLLFCPPPFSGHYCICCPTKVGEREAVQFVR